MSYQHKSPTYLHLAYILCCLAGVLEHASPHHGTHHVSPQSLLAALEFPRTVPPNNSLWRLRRFPTSTIAIICNGNPRLTHSSVTPNAVGAIISHAGPRSQTHTKLSP
ncbi:hypothetical protein DSO57_1012334 [Entomophthora muscae]|uniref:Uncharacterized protein n=1 Tax=Entomophthora muscae TaxID=34485 RepID=A0ACC2U4H0_9FUNG|nr:hypothetical protein DSO57_1012334 [Entomophthora muscae]